MRSGIEMQTKDNAIVKAYHQDRIARFGQSTVEALGWKNEDSQRKRFQDFCDFADLNGKSVLDVGCGQADFYHFLTNRYRDLRYTGIDQSSSFLQEAWRNLEGSTNAKLLIGEFGSALLPVSDYVVCIGALNYRTSESGFIQRMISKLYGISRLGLGLSLLNHLDAGFDNGILVSYDPDEIFEYCQQLSGNIRMKNSPETDFFTLFLYHN
jgi:SAM-dependent methyltransferase